MKIKSIEPTPSPNSMKINLDHALPHGVSYNFNQQNKAEAPDYIQKLLALEGVRGVFQVNDFIALERNPKADWKVVLPQARAILEDQESSAGKANQSGPTVNEHFGEIQVFYQMFKGIPMQIKLIRGEEEKRVGLPQRFLDAATKAQPSADNLILERRWEEKGVRYGEMDEVADQLVEEVSAAYDEERLDRLVSRAFEKDQTTIEEQFSLEQVIEALDDRDWRIRYAAVERMDLSEQTIPALQKAIHDEKMSIRRLATAYLGEIGGEYGGDKVLPILYEALRDESPIVRRTAGDAISDIGDPAAIEQMKIALQDRNKLVRWRAARYMYEVGDETAIDALRSAQDDPEFEVSLQVQLALERIERGEQAEGTVWQQMTRRREGQGNE